MNAAVFAYSRAGIQTAKRVSLALHDMDVSLYTLARLEEPGFLPIEPSVYALEFSRRDALIFVGACGIAVREIAPYVRDKKTDPAVLVLDERARHVIPLLSGHIGGANRLTVQLSSALGAEAVITTATDVNGKFAVDEFAARAGCAISDMQLAKAFASCMSEIAQPARAANSSTANFPFTSVAVVMTASAPSALDSCTVSRFAPPMCPERSGITCRARSSRTKTAGSVFLSRTYGAISRTAMPHAPTKINASLRENSSA